MQQIDEHWIKSGMMLKEIYHHWVDDNLVIQKNKRI